MNNFINEMLPHLKVEDFPGKYGIVAERIGIPGALTLIEKVPGIEISIPIRARTYFIRNQILEKYDGSNALSLAVKFGFDGAEVRKIIKTHKSFHEPFSAQILQLIKSECGEDIVQKLVCEFPGERIFVPSDFYFIKKIYIERNFTGNNCFELSVLLGCSDRYVRNVISELYAQKRAFKHSLM